MGPAKRLVRAVGAPCSLAVLASDWARARDMGPVHGAPELEVGVTSATVISSRENSVG